jgi:hypothetical protein
MSSVVRDFRFSQRFCWVFKSSVLLDCVTLGDEETTFVETSANTQPNDTASYAGLSPSLTPGFLVTKCILITKYLVSYITHGLTGWAVQGSNPGRGKIIFSIAKRPDHLWGPPNFLFNSYQGSFLELKRPEHEVDHSFQSNAEVKNKWSSTSTSLTRLHGADRENFVFYHTCVYVCVHYITSDWIPNFIYLNNVIRSWYNFCWS